VLLSLISLYLHHASDIKVTGAQSVGQSLAARRAISRTRTRTPPPNRSEGASYPTAKSVGRGLAPRRPVVTATPSRTVLARNPTAARPLPRGIAPSPSRPGGKVRRGILQASLPLPYLSNTPAVLKAPSVPAPSDYPGKPAAGAVPAGRR